MVSRRFGRGNEFQEVRADRIRPAGVVAGRWVKVPQSAGNYGLAGRGSLIMKKGNANRTILVEFERNRKSVTID